MNLSRSFLAFLFLSFLFNHWIQGQSPTFSSTPIISIEAGNPYGYTITTEDANGDDIVVTAPTLPDWLALVTTYSVSTFAGSGSAGSANDTGVSASFNLPAGVAVDGLGNIYVADNENHLIRKITPSGDVTTIAGTGSSGSVDGNGTSASFNLPTGVAVDASGNVYVADRSNHIIRKIATDGEVTTLAGSGSAGNADGNGTSASFNLPSGITVDESGNVYVTDLLNHQVRVIAANGDVSTLAGSGSQGSADGNGTSASFGFPSGIAVSSSGDVYVADVVNNKIRKISSNGDVTTFAGTGSPGSSDGDGANASFNLPSGLSFDAFGNLYVVDRGNNKIRLITPNGEVSTLAGTGSVGSDDGNGLSASFNQPTGVAVGHGHMYIADQANHIIRKLSTTTVELIGDTSGNVGSYGVVLEADDDNSTTTAQNFTIDVIDAPDVSSLVATSVTDNSITLNGNVISDAGAAVVERGFIYALTADDPTPTLAEASGSDVTKVVVSGTTGAFSEILTGLDPSTAYSYAAYATNAVGTNEASILVTATFSDTFFFTSTAITTIDAGTPYSYAVTTNGPSDTEVISVELPEWLSLITNYSVSTFAGSGSEGSTDDNGVSASFNLPTGAIVDQSGNIYVADKENHLIRKIATDGEVTTLAGTGSAGSLDANGTSASFNLPIGVAVDPSGTIYVADQGNHKIRKIATDGEVTTLAGSGSAGSADGNGTSASFNQPSGIDVDASGNVYVADLLNHKIRSIASNGDVTTLAGSGSQGSTDSNGLGASFSFPSGVAVDSFGDVYVADVVNNKIRKVAQNGDVTTYAGIGSQGSTDGPVESASFNLPGGISVDDSGNVYVADRGNNKIRKIAPNGEVSTLAGTGTLGSDEGTGLSASFNQPTGIAVGHGKLYVVDQGNHKIRKLSISSVELNGETDGNVGSHDVVLKADDNLGGIAQQGFAIVVSDVPEVLSSMATSATINSVTLNGEVVSDGGATVTERGFVYSLSDIDPSPTLGESSGSDVTKVVVSGTTGAFSESISGLSVYTDYSFAAYAINSLGSKEGTVLQTTTLSNPPAFTSSPVTTIDAGDTYSYAVTTSDPNGDLVTITAPTLPSWLSLDLDYLVSTYAGSGSVGSVNDNGASASFNQPAGVAIDGSGNVYVADNENHLIRKIASDGEVTTLAGSGGTGSADGNGTSASFNTPTAVAVDADGNVYVADQANHLIRKIATDGEVTTLAGLGSSGNADGNGTSASFNLPSGIAVDDIGNLYVADLLNHKIRKIAVNGDVTTLAGSGSQGSADGNGTNASFRFPSALAVNASGDLFVADVSNHRIRKIAANGDVTTFAGSGSSGSADGNGVSASFNLPSGISVDAYNNVYVVDRGNNKIRKITSDGEVTTLAGSGSVGSDEGSGLIASFNQPTGVASEQGKIYVADQGNHTIRIINVSAVEVLGNSEGSAGSYDVTLEANDGKGGIAEQSFSVLVSGVPSVTTQTATAIQGNLATFNGDVTSDGGVAISERGFVYSLTAVDDTPTVVESSGADVTKVVVSGTTGSFSENIASLTAASEYSFAAYATNGVGTTHGLTKPVSTFSLARTFTSTPVTTVDVGDVYSYTITTEGPTGDNVSITAPTLPNWLNVLINHSTETLAGSGSAGSDNDNGTSASFNLPAGVAVDDLGNVYVADTENNLVRKVGLFGDVTTIAGSGSAGSDNGNGTSASFNQPTGVAVDDSGNVYVADTENHLIRKIDTSGEVTTVAGSGSSGDVNDNGINASFNLPSGIAVDASGNLYIADQGNHEIRRIASNGDVTTYAGSGTSGSANGNGASASFNLPIGIAIDGSGNLYVADLLNHMIRRIAMNGDVTTLAGSGSAGSVDGNGTSASFSNPVGVAIDGFGNVFVADVSNRKIRKIDVNNEVTTVAGSGSSGSADGDNASFNLPTGVAVNGEGNVLVADQGNHKIRKVTVASVELSGNSDGNAGNHNVVLEADDGVSGSAQQSFSIVVGAFVPSVSTAEATSITENSADLNGEVTDDGGGAITERGFVYSLSAIDSSPTEAESSGSDVTKVVVSGTTGIFSEAITGLNAGTEYSFTPYAINEVGTAEGSPQTFMTSNTAPTFTSTPITSIDAGIDYTYSVTTNDSNGDNVAVSATTLPAWLSLIKNYTVTTLAGSSSVGSTDGNGVSASFNLPSGVAIDGSGNVFVADTENHLIRKISASGDVITLAGSGSAGNSDGTGASASFNYPNGVALDGSGNVYVADTENHSIRMVTLTGEVSTLAGSGSSGYANNNGISASFNSPLGVSVDGSGNVYVADTENHTIRLISPTGDVTTLAGSGNAGNSDGTGVTASFDSPSSVSVDDLGDVYVADTENHVIRKVSSSGVVTIHAGSGGVGDTDANGTSASFNLPSSVVVDGRGDVYVTDLGSHRIRKIDASREVTTLAGSGSTGSSDGIGASAGFNLPSGVTVDELGKVYVADQGNHNIRKLSLTSTELTGSTAGNAGSHGVVLEADDGNGGIVEQIFSIDVSAVLPTVTSSAATAITINSATVTGEVTTDGGATIIERGFVYSVSSVDSTPTVAESSGSDVTKVVVAGTTGTYSEELTGLSTSVEYSFAAFATNSTGSAEGSVLTVVPSNLTTPTLSFADITKTFGDSDFTLNASSNSAGTITYSVVGQAGGTSLSGTNNEDVTLGDVGTITIRATQAEEGIYASTTKDITLTINAKPITVTANAGQSKVYGASDEILDFTVTTGVLEFGDSFSGALSRASGENVGQYIISEGTLAIDANYEVTFIGAEFNITSKPISVLVDTNQSKVYASADPVLTYSSESLESGDGFTGALEREEGEEAGQYPISIGTLSAGGNYTLSVDEVNFEVVAKEITITADPGQTKVYGSDDPTFTYAITSGSLESGDSFTGSLFREVGEDVGTFPITLGTLNSPNYNLTLVSADFSIIPKDITVTVNAGQAKVFGTDDPIFGHTITTGSLEADDEFIGVLTRESGEGAGLYTISVGTLSAGSNYNMTFVEGDFSIVRRVISISADIGQSKIYGEADPLLTYTILSGALMSGDSFSGFLSRAVGENAGAYAISVGTLSAGNNYNLIFTSSEFDISVKSIGVTVDPNQSKVYGTNDPSFTYSVTNGSLSFGDAFAGSLSREIGQDVGMYAISKGTLSAGTNYELTVTGAEFRISGKPISITVDPNQSKIYEESDPVLTFTVTNGSLESGDSFTGALSRNAGEDIGTYAITLGSLTLLNYDVTFIGDDFSITSGEIIVTVDAGQFKAYGENDPIYTYTVSGSSSSGVSFSGALARVEGEDVGTYAITRGTLSVPNYSVAFIGSDFTINSKEVTITADAGRYKAYGESDPTFTYRISSGFIESGDSFSGSLSREPGEDAGTYAITMGTLSSPNYNLTLIETDFEIRRRGITVKPNHGLSKVFGDLDPALDFQVTNGSLVFGDSFVGSLTRDEGEDVGAYIIRQGSLSAGINYDLSFVASDFNIATKGITITVDPAQSKVYGNPDPVFTYSSDDLEVGDSFSGSLSRLAGKNVGSYAITMGTLTAGANYSVDFVSAEFSIIPIALTVSADLGQSKVFGDEDPDLTYNVTSGALVSGDSFAGSLSRTAGEAAGSYPISIGTLSPGGNYDLTFVGTDFTITQVLDVERLKESNEVTVFVNNSALTVRMNRHLSNATISIYNLNGTLLTQIRNAEFIGNDWSMSFDKRGMFILTIESEDEHFVKRFVRAD